MQERNAPDISLYRFILNALEPDTCKFELVRISCEMEIDTGCSFLLSKEQFKKLPNAVISKKGLM